MFSMSMSNVPEISPNRFYSSLISHCIQCNSQTITETLALSLLQTEQAPY